MTAPSIFGVTHDTVRKHHFPQWSAFTTGSNPSADTITEKILECAGELEAKLLQEDITASAITDSTSAAYLWCQKTLKLMAALEILTIATQAVPPISSQWQGWLDKRWENLADNSNLALGGGVAAPATQPDGPTHHIAQLLIDVGEPALDASPAIPPFRQSDEQ